MILTYLAYLITFGAALIYGKKLYGSWVAAVFLAIFSGPLLAVANMVVGFSLAVLVPFFPFQISVDNEWFQGFSRLLSAGVVAVTLRHFAKTEGKTTSVEHKKQDSSPTQPSSYDSAWK